jgi:hypothetical protein
MLKPRRIYGTVAIGLVIGAATFLAIALYLAISDM